MLSVHYFGHLDQPVVDDAVVVDAGRFADERTAYCVRPSFGVQTF